MSINDTMSLPTNFGGRSESEDMDVDLSANLNDSNVGRFGGGRGGLGLGR